MVHLFVLVQMWTVFGIAPGVDHKDQSIEVLSREIVRAIHNAQLSFMICGCCIHVRDRDSELVTVFVYATCRADFCCGVAILKCVELSGHEA